MIFLIEYNRQKGSIVRWEKYDDRDRDEAANARLEIELDLNRRGIDHEVVLLEALSEEALRQTHRRYFESATEIAKWPLVADGSEAPIGPRPRPQRRDTGRQSTTSGD